MAEEKLNIYQKLAKIRKMAEYLRKTKEGHGYKYTPEAEILLKVTAGMEKYGVSLIPRLTPGTDTLTRSKRKKPTQDDIHLVKSILDKYPYESRRDCDAVTAMMRAKGHVSDAKQWIGYLYTSNENCSCYHSEYKTPRCWGTKEMDECSCGGNKKDCDFYVFDENGKQIGFK